MAKQSAFVVFPGQGSQFNGMGKTWFDNFATYRDILEEASDACGLHLKKLSLEASESDIRDTEIAQPLILTVAFAIWRVLNTQFDLGERIEPTFGGHSLGEYTALTAAGVLNLSDAVKIVRLRGRFMNEACPAGTGGMRALILREPAAREPAARESAAREPAAREPSARERLDALCEFVSQRAKLVSLANWNTDLQVVVAGYNEGLAVIDEVAGEGEWSWVRRSIVLEVSGPFHSPLMKPAEANLAQTLAETAFASSDFSYIPNVTGVVAGLRNATRVQDALVKQISGLVLWYPSLLAARERCSHHIEIGPSRVLTNMAARIRALSDWKFVHFDEPLSVEGKLDALE